MCWIKGPVPFSYPYTASTDTAGSHTITATDVSSVTATATVAIAVSTPILTAAEASDGSHTDVNWDFSQGPPDNAAGFDLVRDVNSSGNFTEIAAGLDPSTTDYTDTDVANGNTYTYEIRPYTVQNGTKTYGDYSDSQTVAMVGMITATPPDDPIVADSSGVVSIDVPFSDSNPSATHSASIDWGDGTSVSSQSSGGTGAISVTEPSGSLPGTIVASDDYSAPGDYTATITIQNSDGTTTTVPVAIYGLPATPTFSAALNSANPQNSIVLTYATADGSHLELEEMGPTDPNYHLIADLGSPAPNLTQTYTLSNLQPSSSYSFRLRADKNQQVTYTYASIETADPITGGNTTYPYSAPTIVSAGAAYDLFSANVTLSTDGDPSMLSAGGPVERVAPADPYHIYLTDAPLGVDYFNSDGVGQGGFESEAGWTVRFRAQLDESDGASGAVPVSPYSDWQSVTLGGATISAPTNFQVSGPTANTVTASWTASVSSDFYTVDSYSIYGVTTSGTAQPIAGVYAPTTTCTFSADSNMVEYFVVANGIDNPGGATSSGYCHRARKTGH